MIELKKQSFRVIAEVTTVYEYDLRDLQGYDITPEKVKEWIEDDPGEFGEIFNDSENIVDAEVHVTKVDILGEDVE